MLELKTDLYQTIKDERAMKVQETIIFFQRKEVIGWKLL